MFPTPHLLKPVFYRASLEGAPVQVKAELRENGDIHATAVVSCGLDPEIGGLIQRGDLTYRITAAPYGRTPGYLDLQLKLEEPEE